ncbi:MAG TPA: erythromycin esterase family protein [Gemmatimonadaceae bacterium]|nr:erythromycin esterase family protein [Gemmatimonadaceae bacterium]
MTTLRFVPSVALCVLGASAAHAQPDRVAWLRANAVALSDSATDASLASIRRALAGVDVVFLGESTHGDGAGHLARVRLVRYLHEQLGFDVIAWEAGLREAVAFDSLLGTAAPVGNITPIALYPWWAPSAELRPMLEYVRRTHRTSRPLTFAGFDLQRSGPVDSLGAYVRRAFAKAGDTAQIPASLADSAEGVLLEAIPDLRRRLASRREQFTRALGERETSLLARVLDNLVAYREQQRLARDTSAAGRVAGYNLREQRNADNVLWLLRERHRGRKIIVWSHNVHAVSTRFTARFDGVGNDRATAPRDATARIVEDSLGARSYAIAIVSYGGTWGFPGGEQSTLPTAPAGSLTAMLHEAGFARAFFDVRGNGRANPPWLRTPLTGTLNAQSPARYPLVWPDVVDGMLYIDRMTPSTIAPE